MTIIDENSRLGIVLSAEIVKEYPNITSLMNEELLLNLEPFDKAISNAPIIFFTPRIRKIDQDGKNDIILKFKEIIAHLKRNTSIVFNIPLGIGGNNEIISLIEHQSGLIVGSDVFYYYNPLTKIKTDEIILGYHQQKYNDPLFNSILNLIGKNNSKRELKIVKIPSAELLYSINIVNRYSNLICINEIIKQTKSKEIRNEIFYKNIEPIYFDEIANGLFDLRIISLFLSSSTALGYIVKGTIRSIEGFIKNLVEETRSQLKAREIKASRTKITILWTIDNHEIRGDKAVVRELLELKLRDYIADVEIQDIDNFLPNMITNVIIACSSEDYKKISSKIDKNQQHHQNFKTILVSANTIFSTKEI